MKMYDLSRFRTQIMGAATIGVILCRAVLWNDELPLLLRKFCHSEISA